MGASIAGGRKSGRGRRGVPRYGAMADPGALAADMWARYLCGELG